LVLVFLSMTRTLFFLALCLLLIHDGNSQINVDSIVTRYSSTSGQTAYSSLVHRLQNFDSTLVKQDFIALYYGSVAQPNYNHELIDSIENKIKEYNLLQEFMQAYELSDSLLKIHPVSITAYFEKTFACYGLKRESEEVLSKQKYMIFSKCVLASGNGLMDSPFQIAVYNDAIEMVKHLQLKYKQLSVEDEHTVVADLSKKYQGVSKLYFKLVHKVL
jgi:hypothetical protein